MPSYGDRWTWNGALEDRVRAGTGFPGHPTYAFRPDPQSGKRLDRGEASLIVSYCLAMRRQCARILALGLDDFPGHRGVLHALLLRLKACRDRSSASVALRQRNGVTQMGLHPWKFDVSIGCGLAVTLLAGGSFAEPMKASTEPRRSTGIEYMNPVVPEVDRPEYKGQRYQALVPDTLDLAERAALAVNGMTGPTDPDADYEIYWQAAFLNNPPYMIQTFNDHCQVKYHEALPLMRLASGSSQREEVDQRWMEVVMQMQGPDGLLYYPLVGRPWGRNGDSCPIYGTIPEADQFTEPFANGRLLGAIAIYYQLTGDERWKTLGERIVDRLTEIAVHKENVAYFTKPIYAMGEVSDAGIVPDSWTGICFAMVPTGLSQFYSATGYEPALALSGDLARYVRYHGDIFDLEGRFIGGRIHFHGHTLALLGLLHYGAAAQDWDMIQFARKGYEYAKTHMISTVGFAPELITPAEYETSEICSVADMISLGIKLTLAGAGDYWDEVDRWIRNQFAEGQLTSTEWVDQMVKDKPYGLDRLSPHMPRNPTPVTDRVPERNIGGFAAWPSMNDLQRDIADGLTLCACCTGNGARAIYYAWENILTYRDGKLRVNLLLNRASTWADVGSYIPYEGRVDIKMKTACELSIRIPEWAAPKDTTCRINGAGRALSWIGRYAVVGKVSAKDVVTLNFPIFERTTVVNLASIFPDLTDGKDYTYTLIRKGNDVVHIEPKGKYRPFYQRDHYRANTARTRTVERFVADELIDW